MTKYPERNEGDFVMITLPEPMYCSSHSLEECIKERHSVREYKDSSLSLHEVSQLLWVTQGVTDAVRYKRSVPSAGATYPLFVYLVVGKVEGLSAGVYKYEPERHALQEMHSRDIRSALAGAALGQNFIRTAPVSIVIVADCSRTTTRYGERGIRYVHMEVGHVGQNICLECESLGLGTVAVGAFDDRSVSEVMELPPQEKPLYIMPVGRK